MSATAIFLLCLLCFGFGMMCSNNDETQGGGFIFFCIILVITLTRLAVLYL